MRRLTIAFYLLGQAFAQQEPVGKKIADPAAAATADGALYELMKAEYLAEACEDTGWGPFPNASSTSLTAEAYARAHGTSTRTTTPATSRAPGRSIRISSRGCSP